MTKGPDQPRTAEEARNRMMEFAQEGDTETTIGAILYICKSHDPREETNIIVAKMMRHPDWMGASDFLHLIEGMNAHVVESARRPERPGVIMMRPGWTDRDSGGSRDFPEGEAEYLRSILRWHGIGECRWLTVMEVMRMEGHEEQGFSR